MALLETATVTFIAACLNALDQCVKLINDLATDRKKYADKFQALATQLMGLRAKLDELERSIDERLNKQEELARQQRAACQHMVDEATKPLKYWIFALTILLVGDILLRVLHVIH